MKYIHLTHEDGQFRPAEITQDEAGLIRSSKWVVVVEDRVWSAWQRHLDDAATWDALWLNLNKTRDR